MALLSFCCRLMRCLSPQMNSEHKRGIEVEEAEDASDDLTIIKGIGIVTQDHLYKAGIRTYGDLAKADPETIIQATGQQNAGSKIADWIAQAQKLEAQTKQ